MGLTAEDVADITSNWSMTADMAKQAVLDNGGFTWGASSLFVGTSARSLSGACGRVELCIILRKLSGRMV